LFSPFVCFTFYFLCSVFWYCFSPYVLFIFYLYTVYQPLPLGANPIAVNKSHIIYHIVLKWLTVIYQSL